MRSKNLNRIKMVDVEVVKSSQDKYIKNRKKNTKKKKSPGVCWSQFGWFTYRIL